MYKIGLLLLGLVFSTACQTDGGETAAVKKSIEETPVSGGLENADIIRNPVSADQPFDTINVAKLVFEEPSHDFGTVQQGDVVKHVFKFTNMGKAPLIITNAKSTCGCTIPKWPKDPVAPGDTGEVLVNFDTKGKKKYQDKPVTISANTHPPQTIIHLKGTVAQPEE